MMIRPMDFRINTGKMPFLVFIHFEPNLVNIMMNSGIIEVKGLSTVKPHLSGSLTYYNYIE